MVHITSQNLSPVPAQLIQEGETQSDGLQKIGEKRVHL